MIPNLIWTLPADKEMNHEYSARESSSSSSLTARSQSVSTIPAARTTRSRSKVTVDHVKESEFSHKEQILHSNARQTLKFNEH